MHCFGRAPKVKAHVSASKVVVGSANVVPKAGQQPGLVVNPAVAEPVWKVGLQDCGAEVVDAEAVVEGLAGKEGSDVGECGAGQRCRWEGKG